MLGAWCFYLLVNEQLGVARCTRLRPDLMVLWSITRLLVAKGFTQEYDIDSKDTFTPVIKMATVWAVI